MARELIRKGFRKVFIVSEGVDKAGAEGAMQKAGFVWYFHGNLMKWDHNGRVIQKFPLR